MAGTIPVGGMNTDITLDGSQPVRTLKELRQAVTNATSAWKAQNAELKVTGQTTEMAKAKYEGLKNTIAKQKDYISGLAREQKHLVDAQKNVDRTTKDGKIEFGKYGEQIAKNEGQIKRAETRLASLTGQQNKAKKSLDYYKSGLADVQKQIKLNTAVTKSYVDRLTSEGKKYDAAKVQLNGYKKAVDSLSKQQQLQVHELNNIARESGKSSEAYAKQRIRVNETTTSLSKFNSKIKSSQTEVNRLNPGGFNRIANGAKKVTSATSKMKAVMSKTWESVKNGATVAAAGIGAVGAAAISGAKKSANLQQSYKEITNLAVTGGEKLKAVTANVTKMQQQGRDMSIKYGKSQQSIAEAYEDLVKRGYTTEQALGAMRTELQGSVASGDDFTDVVKVSSTTLESFGMRAKTTAEMTKNTRRAVNELAYAADMTSTGFKDLGYGMSYVGASAHQAGIPLSETASAMGILSNNGIEASKAGTGLNQVINRLSDSASKLASGSKKSLLAQIGITPKEILDSKGNLKSLSTVFGVLNKHMKGFSKTKKINLMKSLFGVNGEQAGLILAKYNKNLGDLSKKTLKAGKDGDYVAKLSAKNSETAKMQMARLRQTSNAFTMTLGAKMLPAINKAGDSLVKFLTKSKDGKKLTKDFSNAVGSLSNGIVKAIEWIAGHKTEVKWIAGGLVGAVGIAKLAKFTVALNNTRLAIKGLSIGSHLSNGWDKLIIHLSNGNTKIDKAFKFLSKGFKGIGKDIAKAATATGKGFSKIIKGTGKLAKKVSSALINGFKNLGPKLAHLGSKLAKSLSNGFKKSVDFGKGLFNKGGNAGNLTGLLQSAHSAGGFKSLTTAGKVGTGLAGAGIVADVGANLFNAVKDRHSADKRSQDIGKGIGAGIGGGIGLWFGGPAGAAIGAEIGKVVGGWGGKAVNKFTKGWQSSKPPKSFWSLENLGWSAHSMWNGFTKGVSKTINWFKKNWKEVGLYLVSPIAGGINSLYKHNAKFKKWADGLAKSLKNAWKGTTKWFTKLGKDTSKGLKSSWKGMDKWFDKIGKGVKKNWKGMSSWFSKLGKNMSKGLKSSWKNVTKWFTNIGKGIKNNWKGMTSFFSSLGKKTANFFKNPWKNIKGWFDDIVKSIRSSWDGLTKGINSGLKGLSKINIGDFHFANGTDWRKRYGVPAILNDGNDSPETGNREGVLNPDGTIEVINGRNVKRRLLPWQDVINAHDMATMFGKANHFANGTKRVIKAGSDNSKLIKLIDSEIKKRDRRYQDAKDHRDKLDRRRDKKDSAAEKKRAEAKARAKSQKKELDKLGDRISKALKTGNAEQAKKLTAEFNSLSKKYSASKKAAKKPNKHAGQTLVDQGLLIGASRRIGHSQWISNSLFKKLTTAPKAKKKTRKTSTTRRKTTRRRKSSSSNSGYSLGTSISTASGKTRSSSVNVKSVNQLSKALSKLKSKTIKVTVKVKGQSSVKKLTKAIKKVKGKKPKIKVKVTGTSNLKKLQKSITTTHKRVTSLDKAVKKNKFGKEIAEQSEKATKSLKGKGDFSKTFSKMVKDVDKDIKSMKKSATSEFDSMEKKIQASMKKIHTGVVKLATSTATGFKNALHKMVGYAGSDMKSTIAQLNRGIKGINKVLSQFGGNTAVIKPVKFARGTVNGALTHDTLAMVNDAEYGPKQEAVIRGNDVLLPQYDNQIVKLQAGDKVLNGDQTLELAHSFGLPHFAKGSGVSHSALRKLAEKSLKNFAQAFKSMFTKNVDTKGHGIEKDFTNLSKRSSTHYGEPWSQAIWTVIENAIGDGIGKGGTREAFLHYAEKTFAGVKYVMGAASKIASDCSGMVSQALKHFGLDIGRTTVAMQNSAGVQYLGKDISKTIPGDLVIFGHGAGAAGHVGIVKDPSRDTMFNETPPSARVSRISDNKSMGYGFYRLKGLHNANSKKHKGPTKKLLALTKKELGSKAIAWIKKHLSETISSFKITGDIGTRANLLAKALRKLDSHATKNGITAILGNWSLESTLDPSSVNPDGGASGLGQWLDSRQTALKAYAKKHHKSWQDAATQLEFALHGDDPADRATFKSILEGKGSVASLAGRFSAEWERGGYNTGHIARAEQLAPSIKFANGGITDKPAIFGEKGPEMAIPLVPTKATRAWELIGKAVGILSNQTGFSNQQPVVDQKEKKEEHEFRQAVLLLLQQLANKDGSANITLTTPDGRTLWEVVEPFFKENQRSNQVRQRRGLSGNF